MTTLDQLILSRASGSRGGVTEMYIVTVFGAQSDPVACSKFRSRRAAEAFAAEWEGQTYVNRNSAIECDREQLYLVSIDKR
jgi:hypothetical protein